MKILPPVTHPPRQPTTRRHEPKAAFGAEGYQAYRACLRWDFGFTCAFCLTHEADLTGGRTVEGLGVMGVEHGISRATDPNRKNEYSNCFYACRLCNGARATRPGSSGGRFLLDPTRTAWGTHFRRSGDRLLPTEKDANAAYTYEVYDLDDPRKIEMRRLRRELITDRLELLARCPDELEWLLAQVEVSRPGRAREALELARRLRRAALASLEEVARFAAVPPDAPSSCRCGRSDYLSLPLEFEIQSLEFYDGWP